MKTILKYDVNIQKTLILLFVVTLFMGIVTGQDFIFIILIIEFFLIAIFQYSLNLIKFNSKKYVQTDSRKVYIFLSTYVVIGFLTWLCIISLDIRDNSGNIKDIFELMIMSWLFLSPILIIQSLLISFFDFKDIHSKHHES
ncbi:hypothetical protein ACN9MN_05755 [Chryseobacterium sp. S-02]|uniref:hypothetical protein n=1 Tax=Chryseobacterium sp. S-02 TaxID=3404064 RepID=UPI003CF106FD